MKASGAAPASYAVGSNVHLHAAAAGHLSPKRFSRFASFVRTIHCCMINNLLGLCPLIVSIPASKRWGFSFLFPCQSFVLDVVEFSCDTILLYVHVV